MGGAAKWLRSHGTALLYRLLISEARQRSPSMVNFTVHDERTIKTRGLLPVNGINFTTMEYKA